MDDKREAIGIRPSLDRCAEHFSMCCEGRRSERLGFAPTSEQRRLSFRREPDEGWKPRHTAVGQFLITERDRAADRGRSIALGVGESATNGELNAARQLDQYRAQPSYMAAGPRLMADDLRLGVVKRLDFEQRRRTARLIDRTGGSQHQPFATQAFDAGEFDPQVFDAATRFVADHLRAMSGVRSKRFLEHG